MNVSILKLRWKSRIQVASHKFVFCKTLPNLNDYKAFRFNDYGRETARHCLKTISQTRNADVIKWDAVMRPSIHHITDINCWLNLPSSFNNDVNMPGMTGPNLDELAPSVGLFLLGLFSSKNQVEICALLGCYAASSGNSLPTFQVNLSVPPSWNIDSVPLKMGLVCSPETSVRSPHHSLLSSTE